MRTLCGLDDPSDFATTSWIPKTSQTDLIAPPAIIPVPAGAALKKTLPEPFLPFTSKKIKGILQSDNHEMKWSWDNLKNKDFLISEKLKINEPELLFSRIEDSEIQKQIDKLNKNN